MCRVTVLMLFCQPLTLQHIQPYGNNNHLLNSEQTTVVKIQIWLKALWGVVWVWPQWCHVRVTGPTPSWPRTYSVRHGSRVRRGGLRPQLLASAAIEHLLRSESEVYTLHGSSLVGLRYMRSIHHLMLDHIIWTLSIGCSHGISMSNIKWNSSSDVIMWWPHWLTLRELVTFIKSVSIVNLEVWPFFSKQNLIIAVISWHQSTSCSCFYVCISAWNQTCITCALYLSEFTAPTRVNQQRNTWL